MDDELVRLVPCMKGAGPTAASLLIECRGQTPEILNVRTEPRLLSSLPAPHRPACEASTVQQANPVLVP